MSDIQSEICPQCKDVIQGSSKRIIKDSCGHEKCRVCLLQDVDYCRQCDEIGKKYEDDKFTLKNKDPQPENNHTTVITCNKVLHNVDVKIENDLDFELNEEEKNEIPEIQTELSKKSKNKSSQKRRYEMITMPSHISIEGSPPIFLCTICKAKFKTKGHVKYHKFCVGDNKPHICGVCDKSFILKSQLNVHELIHAGKKPYVCNICNKAFRESGKLKRHIVLHSDEKPHICDECGKNFKTLNSLRIHRLIHTGQKPFNCKYCKKRFNNSSNLKKHILSHSDDKTHMCEQCGKKFKQKWALTVHRRSHTHQRDFVCEICNKSFINNKDLKRHESVHLDIKIYSCGICSMSFRRKDNLGRHSKNAHPNKNPEIIKREVKTTEKLKEAIVDNPNAINVITSSTTTKTEDMNNKTPRTCMNGPPKLAFKTSAFKKNYNINRDHPFDSNSREYTKNTEQASVKYSSKIVHKATPIIFPSVYATAGFSVDEYYANRPQVIKNIKFKIPTNYPPEDETVLKTIMKPLQQERESGKKEEKSIGDTSVNNVTHENVTSPQGVTSVIVNSSDQKNVHWRRKMLVP